MANVRKIGCMKPVRNKNLIKWGPKGPRGKKKVKV